MIAKNITNHNETGAVKMFSSGFNMSTVPKACRIVQIEAIIARIIEKAITPFHVLLSHIDFFCHSS